MDRVGRSIRTDVILKQNSQSSRMQRCKLAQVEHLRIDDDPQIAFLVVLFADGKITTMKDRLGTRNGTLGMIRRRVGLVRGWPYVLPT